MIKYQKYNFSLFFSIFFIFSCQTIENQPVITELQGETLQMYEKGKTLFLQQCASCHHNNMISNSVAVALGGITERRTKKWLQKYVRNSMEMIEDKDSITLEIFKNSGVVMSSFPNLTDEEIDQILVYIEATYQNNKIRLRPLER